MGLTADKVAKRAKGGVAFFGGGSWAGLEMLHFRVRFSTQPYFRF